MNRKLFIKNIGLSIVTIMVGPVSSVFSESTNVTNNMKLGSFEGSGNSVKISGKFLDAETLKNISASILIKKEATVFTKKKASHNVKVYSIQNDLGNNLVEKLTFKITALGYKTFEGQLFISKNSVSINSNIWQYNPSFKAENRPNKHKIENGILLANFDFHLVKV